MLESIAIRIFNFKKVAKSLENMLQKRGFNFDLKTSTISPSEEAEQLVKAGVKRAIFIIHKFKSIKNGWFDFKTKHGTLKLYIIDPLQNVNLVPVLSILILSALSKLDAPDDFEAFPPDEIYKESFARIKEILRDRLRSLSPEEAELVIRAVHATGDVDIAWLLEFGKGSIKAGVEALKQGNSILVDSEMVKAGIYHPNLKRFGCRIRLYLNEERTKELAQTLKTTRSAAAVQLAVKEGLLGDVVAFGNSPTALLELIKQIKMGNAKPSLVIASVCGFVNASSAKEKLMKISVPWIVTRGSKGGSAVAASLVNGLLDMAGA
jgi:precorrin-8X/cobalt-precorrin-8 methylmutase